MAESKEKRRSFFSRVFGNYGAADAALGKSGAASLCEKLNAKNGVLSRVRDFICRVFTESKIKNGVHAFLYKLLYIRTRDVGIFLISAGIYAALEYVVMRFAFQRDIGMGVVYSAAVLTLLSLFFFSGRSLADTLNKSRILSFAVFDLIGADKSKITPGPVRIGNSSIALLLGMTTGLLAFILDPAAVPIAIVSVILLTVILYQPESGAVFIAAVLPFAPERMTLALCGFTFASYMLKTVRRKRILRFSLVDVSVMVLGAATLLGRIASPGGASSDGSLYAVCISAYFICRNLLCKKEWLNRAFSAAALSCAVVSSFGLFFHLFGSPARLFGSKSLFADLAQPMRMFFGSASSLASYLLIASPFLLYLTLSGGRKRIAYFTAYAFSLVSLVFTHEVFAVTAALAANFIVLIMYNKKAAAIAVPSVTAAVAAAILIPPSVFGTVADAVYSKSVYDQSVWSGVWGVIRNEWFAGAGVGSFRYVYPVYAKEGFGDAANAGSMYLQITAEGGLILLLLFLLAAVIFISYCVSNLSVNADKDLRCVIYASLTAVFSIMFFGLTDSILTDNRICTFLFFLIGLGAAAAEIVSERAEYEKITMTYAEAFNER